MKEVVPDFQLGEIIRGTNDAGELINHPLLGRTHEFPVTEEVATALNMDARIVGRTLFARAMRNKVATNQLPGDIIKTDPANGLSGLGEMAAQGGAGDRQAYVVDPMIDAAGVAQNDICYVILEGPTRVNKTAAGITAGALIKSGASGKAVGATTGTDAHLTMGTALETTTTETSTLVDMKCEWA